jgi:hypothetical protein
VLDSVISHTSTHLLFACDHAHPTAPPHTAPHFQGKVMQVRKKSDGTILAMKILKKRAIIARNQVEHTRAERKILQSLQHPFLMTLRYAFQSKEKLYFVLDYYQVRPCIRNGHGAPA